jgi:hypothetical protein
MISIFFLLAFFLPQRELNTTRSEVYHRVAKKHASLVNVEANQLLKINSEADLLLYFRDKCWNVTITELSRDDQWYKYSFAPIKIGAVTVDISVTFDDKVQDKTYSFSIDKLKKKSIFPNAYDTLMSKYNKALFVGFRDYLINHEGFTYSWISPPDEKNEAGSRKIILEKDGRRASLIDDNKSFTCLFYTHKW